MPTMRPYEWQGVEINMEKIDIHTHILPPEIPRFRERFGSGNFIHLRHHKDGCGADMVTDKGKLFRKVKKNCFDPTTRVRECDRDGVGTQVISTVPVMFNYHVPPKQGAYIARFLNDHIAEVCANHPGRFIGLGTLPLQSPKMAVKELEHCVQELTFPGVQIGSHVNKWNLSDPALDPFFSAAADMGAAVFVHPWDMLGQARMPKYWLPWLVGMPAESSLAICSMIFGGVFKRHPKLRVAFAHGGGAFPITLGRIRHGFHVRPDLCAVDDDTDPQEYLGHFWLDSLVHDLNALDYIIKLVGANRVCLGSDYPFPLGEERPGKLIQESSLSIEVKRSVLAGAAREWLWD